MESRIENGAGISIESETGTRIENKTGVENECAVKRVTRIGIETRPMEITIDRYKRKNQSFCIRAAAAAGMNYKGKSPKKQVQNNNTCHDNFLWEGKPLRNVTRYGASLSGSPFSHAYGGGGQAPRLHSDPALAVFRQTFLYSVLTYTLTAEDDPGNIAESSKESIVCWFGSLLRLSTEPSTKLLDGLVQSVESPVDPRPGRSPDLNQSVLFTGEQSKKSVSKGNRKNLNYGKEY
ncbi:hypothetical protein EVAR_88766_1 [Eumeta japonica]|uniref:Uncharacterized protein n=1 Tax=Eumeta variegata TaxID=151549 RepID=A0A4C1XTV1_EUMVA|nr:hypothetical protein EVAR_88766_1 [Eumeta japonica]